MFDNEVHYQTFGILENYLDYKSLKQGIILKLIKTNQCAEVTEYLL